MTKIEEKQHKIISLKWYVILGIVLVTGNILFNYLLMEHSIQKSIVSALGICILPIAMYVSSYHRNKKLKEYFISWDDQVACWNTGNGKHQISLSEIKSVDVKLDDVFLTLKNDQKRRIYIDFLTDEKDRKSIKQFFGNLVPIAA